jgi:hypothetical protein
LRAIKSERASEHRVSDSAFVRWHGHRRYNRALTKSAAVESAAKASTMAYRPRNARSKSAVEQLPSLVQMTFGGAHRKKLRWRTSSSLVTMR